MLARTLAFAAALASTASAVELTKATFQTEVKDSGKNAFVSSTSLNLPSGLLAPAAFRAAGARTATLLRWRWR